MTTIKDILETKFIKKDTVIRGQVVITKGPSNYGDGKTMLTVGIADTSGFAKVAVYSANLFPRFQEGKQVAIHNMIKRQDGTIVLTKQSRAFLCNAPFACTEENERGAKNLVDPPPASMVSLEEGLATKPHKTISIQGLIVQEDQQKEVLVGGKTPTKVKDIYLRDEGVNKVKVTLWREATEAPFHPGDHIVITDVVTSSYKGETSFSLTSRSSIKASEAPVIEKTLTVDGVSIIDDEVECLTNTNEVVLMKKKQF